MGRGVAAHGGVTFHEGTTTSAAFMRGKVQRGNNKLSLFAGDALKAVRKSSDAVTSRGLWTAHAPAQPREHLGTQSKVATGQHTPTLLAVR